jgi:hypothetical protein
VSRKNRRDPTPEKIAEIEAKSKAIGDEIKARTEKGIEITPEFLSRAEKVAKEADVLMRKALEKKPDWMIDEKSSMGEVLEFRAYTMPFKHQQMIDIYEKSADSFSELAGNFDDPKQKEHWLKEADRYRKEAEKMRSENWMYRAVSEKAIKEIKELE